MSEDDNRHQLEECNALDLQLHQFVSERLDEQLARIEPSTVRRLKRAD